MSSPFEKMFLNLHDLMMLPSCHALPTYQNLYVCFRFPYHSSCKVFQEFFEVDPCSQILPSSLKCFNTCHLVPMLLLHHSDSCSLAFIFNPTFLVLSLCYCIMRFIVLKFNPSHGSDMIIVFFFWNTTLMKIIA